MKFNQAAKSNLLWSTLYFSIVLILWFLGLLVDKIMNEGGAYAIITSYIPSTYINNIIGTYIMVAIAAITISTLKKM